jgi:ribosomal protein S18 acetylase RimI-like enzyme
VNGAIAAAVASWEEHGRTHWGRFAVQPALRGKHIGTALARHSVEDLFSRGAPEIHLTARESTVHIFCKMGGEITGEPVPFFEGTVTPVILRKESYVN